MNPVIAISERRSAADRLCRNAASREAVLVDSVTGCSLDGMVTIAAPSSRSAANTLRLLRLNCNCVRVADSPSTS